MSTSSQPKLIAGEIRNTRAKFKQFRILVIGRANAGKTTILRRVCDTTDDPMIFDPSGKKVRYNSASSCPILTFMPVILDRLIGPQSISEGKRFDAIDFVGYNVFTPQRGGHDIDNQMIFKSNPGFIFHDSRGFEAGGDRELKLVLQFIQQRSKATNVNEQLHAIWCVGPGFYPTDKLLTQIKCSCVGTAFQQRMTDLSPLLRRSFSVNVGQD